MKTSQTLFLSLSLFSLVACGGGNNVGDVTFRLSIANDNTRDVVVDRAGIDTLLNFSNLIVIMDQVSLQGVANLDIINAPTPARFDAEAQVDFTFQVEEGDFDGLALTLGVADAATAKAAGEVNVEGRTFHFESAIDLDADNVAETGIVVYAPAAQTVNFDVPFSVVAGQQTIVEIVIDPQVMLGGVDFALAEDVEGELALTEDNATDQTPIVSGNVVNAFEMVVQ